MSQLLIDLQMFYGNKQSHINIEVGCCNDELLKKCVTYVMYDPPEVTDFRGTMFISRKKITHQSVVCSKIAGQNPCAEDVCSKIDGHISGSEDGGSCAEDVCSKIKIDCHISGSKDGWIDCLSRTEDGHIKIDRMSIEDAVNLNVNFNYGPIQWEEAVSALKLEIDTMLAVFTMNDATVV